MYKAQKLTYNYLTRENINSIKMRRRVFEMSSVGRKAKLTDEDIDESLLYAVMKSYVLTHAQLQDNGFPLPDPQVRTRVSSRRTLKG
jgi:hypothetical protein